MNYEVMQRIGRDHIGLDFYTSKHCNLKCRGCIRFANIAKPQFYDFEQYKKDIQRFVDIVTMVKIIKSNGNVVLLIKMIG